MQVHCIPSYYSLSDVNDRPLYSTLTFTSITYFLPYRSRDGLCNRLSLSNLEIGGTLVPSRHQVAEVIDGEVDGVVSSQLNRGLEDKEGDVLR